jgi:hypothetical protein
MDPSGRGVVPGERQPEDTAADPGGTMMTHDDIDTRLAAIEGRVPVEAGPPEVAPAAARRRRRSTLALVAAPILVLAVGATALAGAEVIRIVTTTGSSALDVDDAIATAGLECMTPPEAAAWLAAHGYDDVVWDTSAGHGTIDAGPAASALPVLDPDGSLPPAASNTPGEGPGLVPPGVTRTTTPPPDGIVWPGPMMDGTLLMFVDATPGAERPATCPAP